ncbi:MAG TPA: hypothetical protein VEW65_09625 [Chryseolinea sp.]|nr:hypothetical protein [Chryseolinea sp.]
MIRPLIFFFVFSSLHVMGQKKIATRAISDEIVFATIDRVGELYVITKQGQIQKFDVDGKLLSLYKNSPIPTLFEPRDGSRLFAYFRKGRRIEYLNPSLEPSNSMFIDSAFVIDPWLSCSSGDYNIWILDAEDNTIKKINPKTSTVEVDVNVAGEVARDFSSIKFIRDYQGFFFLLDVQKGIHVFNGIGRWIKTISAPNLSYFNFIGEELYYPTSSGLTFVNLFSGEKREMPLSKTFEFALLSDERLYIIERNSVHFFEFKP